MKVLKKTDLLTRRETGFFMEERNALVFAQDSRWITTLYAAFQDEENLYLIMEYVSGGSLRNLLNNRETTMTEPEARFYIAEMILALEEVHRFNYIHRDLKPDNVLIDVTGHLKLGDFGSCIRIGDSVAISSHETVGTPDYISPEILRAQEGNASYGKEVDLWSLGVILYEMLFDEVPFYSESLVETYAKIMGHEKSLEFPSDIEVSSDALDFIRHLICSAENRLGRINGIQELKNHTWFKDFDWKNITSTQPPFVPELSGPQDTRYFSEEDCVEAKKHVKKPLPKTRDFAGQNLPFIGYSYVQDATPVIYYPFHGNDENSSSNVASSTSTMAQSSTDLFIAQEKIATLTAAQCSTSDQIQQLEKSIERLHEEKKRLELDLKRSQSMAAEDNAEKEELQSRLNALRKRQNEADVELKMKLHNVEDERDALVEESVLLKANVSELKQSVDRQEDAILELGKTKSFLEKEIERLAAKISEEKMAKNSMHLKVEDTSRKLDRESRHRATSDLEREQWVRKCQELGETVASLESCLAEESAKSKTLSSSAYELERMKVVLEAELKATKLQLEEAIADKNQPKPRDTSKDALSDLQTEIETLNSNREKFLSEISSMTKVNAILELEVSDINDKLAKEQKEHTRTKSLLTSFESKLSKQSLRILELEQQQTSLENRYSVKIQEHEREANTLQFKISSLADMNQKAESARASLESELTHLKAKATKLEETTAHLLFKNAELQKSITEERRTNSISDVKLKELESQLSESLEKVNNLYHQLRSEKLTHSEELVDLQIQIAKLEQEHLQCKPIQQHDTKHLDEKIQRDTLTIHRLEQDLKAKSAHVVELETHRSLDNVQKITLQDRVNELEIWTLSLQEELDQTKAKLMKATDQLGAGGSGTIPRTPQPGESAKSEKHRLGLKNLFFRSQQQKLEQEKAFQRLNEAENEFRGGSEEVGFHIRQKSSGSAHSLFSHLTKQSEASLCFDFDSTYNLRGLLKTPKDGKVKRGWKQKFAVLRDFKLYIYDRERDVDTHDGLLVADLRSEVFVVKPVPQNELIHTTAKQIECIFKIQCSSKRISEIDSQTNTSIELTKSIEKLQQDIKHEEMMQNAVERMANAAPEEGQKQAFYQQLESSQKKISRMICDLQTLGDQLNTIQMENPNLDLEEVSSQSFDEEVSQAKALIQTSIDEEAKKRDNLKKLATAAASNKQSSEGTPGGKSLKDEVLSSEISIQKLQADLVVLNGSDTTAKRALTRKLVEVSCSEVNALKEIPPLYFMAESSTERIHWVSGLEYFRNEIKKPPPASTHTSRSNSVTNLLVSPSHTPPTPVNHHIRNISQTSSNWYKRMSYQAESPKSLSQSESSLASFQKSSSSGKRMSYQVETVKPSRLVHHSDATINATSSGISTPRAGGNGSTSLCDLRDK
ncbi:UNVERIFIED_CONTAM: hypothetical protein HDU68_001467 [Siphonaria sp. JEL0065]|nr:hypothetical protein HDU68_001467 [Siphonaria sp. JEL0065]